MNNIEKSVSPNLNEQIKKEILKKINFQKNIQLSEKIAKSKNTNSFYVLAKNNNIKINEVFFNNILDNQKIFNKKNMEKIFSKNIKSNLILLQNNIIYIVRIDKISKNNKKIENLDKALSDQVKHDFKALLLRDLDKYLIKKYPVKLNKKVFDQVRKGI